MPLTEDYLKLIIRENLLSKKGLRKLIKAAKGSKEKKVTVKISSDSGPKETVQLSYSSKCVSPNVGIEGECSESKSDFGVKIEDKTMKSLSPILGCRDDRIQTEGKKAKTVTEEKSLKRERSSSRGSEKKSFKRKTSTRDKSSSCERSSNRTSCQEVQCRETKERYREEKRVHMETETGRRCHHREGGGLQVEVKNQLPVSRRVEEKLGRWVEREILGREDRSDGRGTNNRLTKKGDLYDKREVRTARRKVRKISPNRREDRSDRREERTRRRKEREMSPEQRGLAETDPRCGAGEEEGHQQMKKHFVYSSRKHLI